MSLFRHHISELTSICHVVQSLWRNRSQAPAAQSAAPQHVAAPNCPADLKRKLDCTREQPHEFKDAAGDVAHEDPSAKRRRVAAIPERYRQGTLEPVAEEDAPVKPVVTDCASLANGAICKRCTSPSLRGNYGFCAEHRDSDRVRKSSLFFTLSE